MELQHINVKLIARNPGDVEFDRLIPVFHEWIAGQIFPGLLLDIADYRHVHAGPGVILIGHEGDYSVDNTDGSLGVRYNRKAVLAGSNQDRLKQAARAALSAFERLEAESRLEGELRFNGQEIEVFVNDRLLAPNSEATRTAAEPEFRAFFERLFRSREFALSHNSEPRRLFGASAKSVHPFSVAQLLANLDS